MRVLLFFLLIASNVYASFYEFALLWPGAREVGISAPVAAKGGCFSIYVNPASISYTKRAHALFSHTLWYEGVHIDALGLALPKGEVQLAFNALLLYTKFEELDWKGNVQGDFWVYDIGLSATFAKKMGNLSIGVNAKLYQSCLKDYKEMALAIDLGVLAEMEEWWVGVCLQNLGTGMKYIQESLKMPLSLRFGASKELMRNTTLFAQISWVRGEGFGKSVGVEARVLKDFALRAGWGRSLCFGATFLKDRYRVDYTTLFRGELGICHHLCLGVVI